MARGIGYTNSVCVYALVSAEQSYSIAVALSATLQREAWVDFRQIVNTRLVKQETNTLYQSLAPLLQVDAAFADLILLDLAKVMRICGRSRGDIDANELLAYLSVYAQIKKDADKLKAVESWEFSDQVRLQYQKEILRIILELTADSAQAEQLMLPSLLKKLDEERRTNYLEQVVNAVYKFAQVVVKADGDVTMQDMDALSQIWQLLHAYRSLESYQAGLKAAIAQLPTPPTPTSQTALPSTPAPAAPAAAPPVDDGSPKTEAELAQILEDALEELNSLVGMENIKEEVRTLANFLKVQRIRAERGLAKTAVSLHAVFGGPPGTGKTTIARLMSRIYQGLGFLSKGHLIETDRSGLVAGYVGQTAKRVDEVVESALDGVLFIDEAYALVPREGGARDFGQEAIDVLLKRMEDYRDRLVVIVAGYTDEMATFVESNPGLKSRFNRYFYFDHYTPEELTAIYERMAGQSHFKLTSEAREKLFSMFEELYMNRDKTFGNARMARNLFEKSIERQANRLAVMSSFTDEVLTTLLPEDIPDAAPVQAMKPSGA